MRERLLSPMNALPPHCPMWEVLQEFLPFLVREARLRAKQLCKPTQLVSRTAGIHTEASCPRLRLWVHCDMLPLQMSFLALPHRSPTKCPDTTVPQHEPLFLCTRSHSWTRRHGTMHTARSCTAVTQQCLSPLGRHTPLCTCLWAIASMILWGRNGGGPP